MGTRLQQSLILQFDYERFNHRVTNVLNLPTKQFCWRPRHLRLRRRSTASLSPEDCLKPMRRGSRRFVIPIAGYAMAARASRLPLHNSITASRAKSQALALGGIAGIGLESPIPLELLSP